MKIQIYKVKAIVSNNKEVTIQHENRELDTNQTPEEFDEGRIALKAQEVAQFNNNEMESIKQMGPGEYNIEFKLIV